jgi:hypothetical protein
MRRDKLFRSTVVIILAPRSIWRKEAEFRECSRWPSTGSALASSWLTSRLLVTRLSACLRTLRQFRPAAPVPGRKDDLTLCGRCRSTTAPVSPEEAEAEAEELTWEFVEILAERTGSTAAKIVCVPTARGQLCYGWVFAGESLEPRVLDFLTPISTFPRALLMTWIFVELCPRTPQNRSTLVT